MTLDPAIMQRLQFLVRVIRKECQHLDTTDQRLFSNTFTLEQAARLDTDPDLAVLVRLLSSADDGMTIRKLRNQVVHEYVEDPAALVSALQSGHAFVPTLAAAADNMVAEIERRGWV